MNAYVFNYFQQTRLSFPHLPEFVLCTTLYPLWKNFARAVFHRRRYISNVTRQARNIDTQMKINSFSFSIKTFTDSWKNLMTLKRKRCQQEELKCKRCKSPAFE